MSLWSSHGSLWTSLREQLRLGVTHEIWNSFALGHVDNDKTESTQVDSIHAIHSLQQASLSMNQILAPYIKVCRDVEL